MYLYKLHRAKNIKVLKLIQPMQQTSTTKSSKGISQALA